MGALLLSAVSCNEKDTTIEYDDIIVTPATVAVSKFFINANANVLNKLDSVFFTIDLNNGVIFNADSLPKNTKVTRLVPSITFANTMTKVNLKYRLDNRTDTVSDYLTNPDDSIDFSYPVVMEVVAQDTTRSFTYTIKVNVHTQNPDTLLWDRLATASLPARYENPVSQKTVFKDSTAYCLVEEYNGEYTLSTSNDLNQGVWNQENATFGFTPKMDSFTANADSFWILSESGELFTSSDALDWETTGENWVTILGGYGSSILGIKETENNFLHACYPVFDGFVESPVDSNFPISGASNMGVMATKWADTDFAILTGGVTADGELSSAVWAFDGSSWAIINDSDLPPLYKPMLARYVVYRNTPFVFTQRVFDVWMVVGGVNEENSMSRSIYFTYDNGVNWQIASSALALPNTIPNLIGADMIVAGYDLTADLSKAWTLEDSSSYSTRSSYTIDGFDITWVCPYMYIFGGELSNHNLSTLIWRGVIAKLTFTPLI